MEGVHRYVFLSQPTIMIDGGGNNHQIETTDILKKAADENFENLRKQYATGVQRIRDESDESIDIRTFLRFGSI